MAWEPNSVSRRRPEWERGSGDPSGWGMLRIGEERRATIPNQRAHERQPPWTRCFGPTSEG